MFRNAPKKIRWLCLCMASVRGGSFQRSAPTNRQGQRSIVCIKGRSGCGSLILAEQVNDSSLLHDQFGNTLQASRLETFEGTSSVSTSEPSNRKQLEFPVLTTFFSPQHYTIEFNSEKNLLSSNMNLTKIIITLAIILSLAGRSSAIKRRALRANSDNESVKVTKRRLDEVSFLAFYSKTLVVDFDCLLC